MLKTYKTLLFDVDDTLLDFGAAERAALRMLFDGQNIALTEEIETQYKWMNQRLWQSFEEGLIDRNEVVNTRFSLLFKEYGQEVDGCLLEQKYRSYLEEGHQLIDGALELIRSLHDKYDLYIVTNGVSKTQYRRLQDSGLLPYFKAVFVSEDTGYQKPMKEYFQYVFDRIPGIIQEQALLIGDSLNADIRGGMLAGLDTCWLNPSMKEIETGILPTYQIQTLEELYPILQIERDSAVIC